MCAYKDQMQEFDKRQDWQLFMCDVLQKREALESRQKTKMAKLVAQVSVVSMKPKPTGLHRHLESFSQLCCRMLSGAVMLLSKVCSRVA